MKLNQSGLTLVEVAVVAMLLIVVVLGILRTDVTSRYAMRASRVQLETANVLRSYVEQEKAKAYVNMNDSVTNDVIFSDQGTADAADDITGTVTIDVTDNGDDTKTILGVAAWNQRAAGQEIARNLTLQTLVAEP